MYVWYWTDGELCCYNDLLAHGTWAVYAWESGAWCNPGESCWRVPNAPGDWGVED
jgi:hypothetical protein